MGGKGKESGKEFWNLAEYTSTELSATYNYTASPLFQYIVSMLVCPPSLECTSWIEFCFHFCTFKFWTQYIFRNFCWNDRILQPAGHVNQAGAEYNSNF